MAPDSAGATENQEQVIVSPAQQAVNSALATATTEVQQAITATNNAAVEVSQAQTELSQAQPIVAEISSKISIVTMMKYSCIKTLIYSILVAMIVLLDY